MNRTVDTDAANCRDSAPVAADSASGAEFRESGRFGLLPGAILLGAIAAQSVSVVGQLYVGEVLAPLMLLSLLGSLRLSKSEKLLVVFAVLWVVAQLMSDVVNLVPVAVSVKGVLAPLIFASTIVGLGAYFRTRIARVPSFMLGAALGTVLTEVVSPSVYFADNPWKWGIGSLVLVAALLYFSFSRRRTSSVWLLPAAIVFLLVSFFYEARSMALLPLLAVVEYITLFDGRGERFLRFFRGKWGPARLVPVVVIVALVLNAGITVLSTSKLLVSIVSPATAQKFATQSGGTFGVLFGGRSELLISAQAFLDQPLLGHGSWAKDDGNYGWLYAANAYEYGYVDSIRLVGQYDPAANTIPTHSFLMGALVWSGVIGGLFWLVLLQVVLRSFLDARLRLPLYFHVGVTLLLWDVLFSPFGASARWASAAFLAAFLAYLSEYSVDE